MVPWYYCTRVPAMSLSPRTQIRSFHLDAPRAQVFPLFTARGEREWAPGWDPSMLSGAEERGSAFQTRNHDGQETTWIVVEYRPSEGCVSYARLAHGSNIGLVDVICTEPEGGGTDVSVAYTLTPLHAGAEAFVGDFLDPRQYAHMIDGWHAATNAALARLTAARRGRV
jgi:Polyketide cyclase / dehydrase and lipid transport